MERGTLDHLNSHREIDAHFQALFDQFHDPVVEFAFTDGEPVIVQSNDAFREVFCGLESVSNLRLNELIVPDDKAEQAEQFDQRTVAGESNREVVERETCDGLRTFVYHGVPISEDRGFAIYSDITDKVRKEQHLDVLHRVLRHNLRNDANIIISHATEALRLVENDDAREYLQTVIDTSNGLSKLCSEANTIRKVFDFDRDTHPVGLNAVVNSVVDDCSDRFDGSEIVIDGCDQLLVSADGRLEVLIDSLVDNAVRHNTSDVPRVTVSLSKQGSMGRLVVSDNGPGIPRVEQNILTEDIDISSLEHGSGLGLWLVKWLVQCYSGSILVNSSDSGGSSVVVELPLSAN